MSQDTLTTPVSPIDSQVRPRSDSLTTPSTPTGPRYSLLPSPLPPSRWDTRLQEIYNIAWPAVTLLEDDGWQFNQEVDGVKIYLKKLDDGSSGKSKSLSYCKGIGQIPHDIETVRCVLACAETRSQWDSMYNMGRVVELVDPNTVISYANFNAPWPVSGRDFVTIGRSIILPEGGIFVYHGSVEHSDTPVTSKYVRGEVLFSTLLLKPNPEDPSVTDVVYALAQDPKGSLPKSLVDSANLLQPRTIATVRDVISNKPTIVQTALAVEAKNFKDALAISKPVEEADINSTDGQTSSTGTDTPKTIASDNTFTPATEGQFNQDDYSFSVVLPDTELTPEQKQHLDDAFAKAWEGCHSDEGWDYYKEIEGIKIWMKPSGVGPVKLSKGVGIIAASPSATHSMFTNESTRKEWDTMFNSGSVIEQIDLNTYMGYGAFNAPWPISGRDFTTITRTCLLTDGSIFHWSTNFVTPKCPPGTKFVRGKLLWSGLLIAPIENGTQSRITYSIGSDPSGSLPAAVAEAAALSQPLCIAAIAGVVKKSPHVVETAVAATRTKYEKLTGAGSGFDISRETLPSIGSIDWPDTSDVQNSDDTPGTGLLWLNELHKFYNTSNAAQFRSALDYARENGGVFRSLSPDFVNTAPDAANNAHILQNIPFGHLAFKVTHLRGKYLSVLNNMLLYFTLTFENSTVRTSSAPHFDGVNPNTGKDKDALKPPPSGFTNHFSKPITRPDSILLIELWGEQRSDQHNGVSRACLGSLRLTLGELFEGNEPHSTHRGNNSVGYGSPTKARRCWFPLTNVPIEIDRTCTHYELLQLKTKTGRNKLSAHSAGDIDDDTAAGIQYLDDPRGLFICFESCVIFSQVALFMNDVLSMESSHTQYSNPRSTLSAMQLALPPTLCKHPNKLLELAHAPKDPELCRQAGKIALTITGGQLLLSDIEPDDLAIATSTFSAHLFVRNIIRCLVAFGPLLTITNVAYDLLAWTSPVHTLFTMALIVFMFYNPYLIIPTVSMFILFTIMSASADYHFLQAAARSNTTYATSLKQRYIIAQQYTDRIHELIPTLSARSQAIGLVIQVITGRVATVLEMFSSFFQWNRINDTALTVALIAFATLCISAYSVLTHHLPMIIFGNVVQNQHILAPQMTQTTSLLKDSVMPEDPTWVTVLVQNLFNSENQSTLLLVSPMTIIVPIVLILSWNSTPLLRFKLLLGSLFRSNLILGHIRRESRTVRLFSGEPKTQ